MFSGFNYITLLLINCLFNNYKTFIHYLLFDNISSNVRILHVQQLTLWLTRDYCIIHMYGITYIVCFVTATGSITAAKRLPDLINVCKFKQELNNVRISHRAFVFLFHDNMVTLQSINTTNKYLILDTNTNCVAWWGWWCWLLFAIKFNKNYFLAVQDACVQFSGVTTVVTSQFVIWNQTHFQWNLNFFHISN